MWIVLNDARYNMCEQGMSVLGLQADARIPPVDFAMFAQALGAKGEIVESEMDLDGALERADHGAKPVRTGCQDRPGLPCAIDGT